jgi:hypothetical protein
MDLRTVLLTILIASFLLPSAQAGVRLCYTPPGTAIPENVLEAASRPGSDEDVPGGYNKLLEQIVQNRRALERGEISEKMAGDRGGLAITGNKSFPVLPFTFANVPAPYWFGNLDMQLFNGPWATGTLAGYYDEISYGNLSVSGIVTTWTVLTEDDNYYEENNNGLWPNENLHDDRTLWLNKLHPRASAFRPKPNSF